MRASRRTPGWSRSIASTGNVKRDPGGEEWIEHSALTVMNPDGSGRRVVYQGPAYGGDLSYPVFSPNGKQLVFERTSSGFTSRPNTRAVFVVNLDGSGLKQLTPWPENSGDNPDGRADVRCTRRPEHVRRDDGARRELSETTTRRRRLGLPRVRGDRRAGHVGVQARRRVTSRRGSAGA